MPVPSGRYSAVNRQAVGEQLVRAGELGAFSAASTESRWFGARVRNVQETEAASELADELAAALHSTRRAVDTAAAQAGLRPGRTVTAPLERAMDRGSLTARGHQRVLRVAWTLADLEGRGAPVADDVDTALYFRSLVPA